MFNLTLLNAEVECINITKQYHELCRACLRQEGVIDIFEIKHNNLLLRDLFMIFSIIQADASDGYPHKICQPCADLITQFYSFKKMVTENQIILQIASGTVTMNNSSLPLQFDIKSEINETVPPPDIKPDSNDDVVLKEEEIVIKIDNDEQEQPPEEYSCVYCNLKFNSKLEYNVHRKQEARKKTVCPFCKKIMHSTKFDDHLRLKHKKLPPIKCDICGKRFVSGAAFKIHMHGHKDGYFCEICGRKCLTTRALDAHRTAHEREKKIHGCDVCGKVFKYAYLVEQHKNTHTGDRPFLCSECGAAFTSQQRLHQHNLERHADRPYECHLCDGKFTTSAKLERHVQRHKNEKNNECETCGRKFKHVSFLKMHARTHSLLDVEEGKNNSVYREAVQKNKNICHSCDRSYSKYLRSNYQLHIRSHIGESPFLCLLCGKQFQVEEEYRQHAELHGSQKLERLYPCDICHSVWASNAMLKYHMRYHTGEKPFQCNYCEKKFTIKAHLNTHLRWHTGEKPFSCDFCGKTFSLKGNLDQHVKTHSGQRDHVCNWCGKSFYTGSSLRKHHQTHQKRIQ